MKTLWNKGWFAGAISFLTFLLVLAALHDMQRAQGVGLYLSLLNGSDTRVIYDVLVDSLAILILFLLLFLPCLLLKRYSARSFARLFAAYLALMPGVDLAYLVHVFDPPGVFALRQAFVEMEITEGLFAGMGEISSVIRLWIPILSLLMLGNQVQGHKGLKRWQYVLLGVQFPLFLGVFLFPALSSFFSFFAQYLLLVICFDIWETWYTIYPKLQLGGSILFGGFWLRGLYLMIEVMSIFHM